MGKVPCPFNATHYVLPSERDAHMERCPERHIVEKDILRRGRGIWDEEEGEGEREVQGRSQRSFLCKTIP